MSAYVFILVYEAKVVIKDLLLMKYPVFIQFRFMGKDKNMIGQTVFPVGSLEQPSGGAFRIKYAVTGQQLGGEQLWGVCKNNGH